MQLTYDDVGASAEGSPSGFVLDHNRVQVGQGMPTFNAACEALRRWEMFPKSWTEVHPPNTPLTVGNTVAVLFRAFGCWSVSSARIVYLVDETLPTRRFGFAYGTLPGHIERGEERFMVELLSDETVWFDTRAFSRPGHWLIRLGYPIARRFQRRFVRDSQAAMRDFVARQPTQ